jgi:hypothetical protein
MTGSSQNHKENASGPRAKWSQRTEQLSESESDSDIQQKVDNLLNEKAASKDNCNKEDSFLKIRNCKRIYSRGQNMSRYYHTAG